MEGCEEPGTRMKLRENVSGLNIAETLLMVEDK